MKTVSKSRKFVLGLLLTAAGIGAAGSLAALYSGGAAAQTAAPNGAAPEINFPAISSQSAQPPSDISVQGGAPNPTITDAAVFAWQEFIALNWPAVNQTGAANTRGVADTSKKFGDDSSGPNQANQPVVWETYRGKVETFPGVGNPPGCNTDCSNGPDYGFDVGPQYIYGIRSTTPAKSQVPPAVQNNNITDPQLNVPACQNPTQPNVAKPPYINLDEITQIGLDSMFAGVLPSSIQKPTYLTANAEPQLIRFLAKGNRTFYDYVVANSYWYKNAAYNTAVSNFNTAAVANKYPAPTPTMKLPAGTILVKAAWRPLGPNDTAADFHTKTVRFYDQNGNQPAPCYREQTWALIALHIIQKTPSAPDFIFATFEYTSNILTTGGKPVEDQNGAETNAPAGDAMDPKLNYWDVDGKFYSPDQPKGSAVPPPPSGQPLPLVQVTAPYCKAAGNKRIYFQDIDLKEHPIPPPNSGVCVNKRYFSIPSQIQDVNKAAHKALNLYGAPALWQNYKLVNVQWQPFNIGDIDTSSANTNTSRLKSTFGLANSVVETDNTLQQFFGGLFAGREQNGFFKSAYEGNTINNGTAYNIYDPPGSTPGQFTRMIMGGCMGCHGRAQRAGTDFSFTLAGGPVKKPEFGVPAGKGLAAAARNNVKVGFDEDRLQALYHALSGQ
jgi:hypothetical protein